MNLLEMLLGSVGRAIVDWLVLNADLISVVLFVYFLLYISAKSQLYKIKRLSEAMVLETARKLASENKPITPGKLYRQLNPIWEKSVRVWARYIPHRWELWVVPSKPENVKQKLNFSPEWITHLLVKHKYLINKNTSPANKEL